MVVIAAGAEEGCLRAHPRRELEAEDARVERKRAVEVGDLEVDVPDVYAGIDRVGHFSIIA